MDPFLGQVILFAGNFAPRGWALCDGQILPIDQYSALFSILGTTYGGDGRTTFALPDLRGRAPVHVGTGPGLSPRQLGQKGGAEEVTLTSAQMPTHTHVANGTKSRGDKRGPGAASWARSRGMTYSETDDPVAMTDSAIGASGGNQAHDNLPPYLAMNYIIALQGTFPSRS